MPTRPDAAAKAAMALYADAPRADRAHVGGRWWTAPFTAVEKSLPTTGRVLEVGCGHGLFVAYAALTGPRRTVVGPGRAGAHQRTGDRHRRGLHQGPHPPSRAGWW